MDLAVACVERGEEERCINREKRVGMCIGVRLLSRVIAAVRRVKV